jgi:hypothetical protein
MPSFPYKTQPYDHQRKALLETATRKYAALFAEPGTGKTKIILDNAAFLYRRGDIQALLVFAPSGVHVNWIREELPLHMSEEVPTEIFIWYSRKSRQKGYQRDFRNFMAGIHNPKALRVLAMNIEAIITDAGSKAARNMLDSFSTMLVIDESTDIKTPGAKRTRRAKALGRLASHRRILSGLPDPEGPVDLYAQLSFLSPHIVGTNVAKFKARYCEFEQTYVGGGKTIQTVSGYRNLEELTRIVQGVSFRVRKEDCLDLPPKVYTKRFFEMSVEQERMYRELDEQLTTEFPDGQEVTARIAIVRMLRQQQIAAGYVPPDDWNVDSQEPVRRIPGPNPRLDAMKDIVEKYPGQMIVWVRYRMDSTLLLELLGKDAVRYDGEVKDKQREENMDRFKKGEVRFIVASPKAMARGFTLHMAQTCVFYSHYWGLEARIQAEDRAHRAGLKHTVTYVDVLAEDSVDEKIVKALRNKDDLARRVMGDPRRNWI